MAILFTFAIDGQERRLTIADGGQLNLERKQPDALSGTFRRDERIAIFRSEVRGPERMFELLDSKRAPVVRVTATAKEVTVAVLGERLVMTSPRGDEPRFELRSGNANIEVLDELTRNEAYALLPNLAIELVHNGIVGDERYPAAQFIHGIAVASARARGFQMPLLNLDNDKAQPVSLLSPCQNLKDNPNKDHCYGMCGNECTCWWPVCATCCGCEGCHTHDWACRITECPDIKLTPAQKLVFKAGCYTFAAFLAAPIPCLRYDKGKHSPPCAQ